MKKLQEEKLAPWIQQGLQVHWHDRIENVPAEDNKTFTMLVAHEFFDALPIHMFEKRAEGWREVFVDIDVRKPLAENSSVLIPGANSHVATPKPAADDKPKLRLVASPSATLAANLLVREDDKRFQGLSQGTRVEVCPDLYGIGAAAAKLVQPSGAGLIVDYGDERFFNHSFRVSGHVRRPVFPDALTCFNEGVQKSQAGRSA